MERTEKGVKQNIRLRSLGENHSEDALRAVIAGTKHHVPRKKRSYIRPQKASLLIDVQAKLAEGKGGYRQWASVFNLKQMAKTVLYLQEHDLADYEELASKVADASGHCDVLTAKIRAAEQRMAEINTLKTHIINYAHTREIFAAYKSPATSNTSWQSMRKKSGATGRPRKRSTGPVFRSCLRSRACKRNLPNC